MTARAHATRWPVWALIRRARQLAGLTQAQLAERAGSSQPAIAR
jgi:transcriptional regulator with XRE-family HTH domain